jgi:hypothetical protein
MEMSGRVHALADLLRGSSPQYPMGGRVGVLETNIWLTFSRDVIRWTAVHKSCVTGRLGG